MATDFDKIFRRGGKDLVALLKYVVRAANADLLFVYLVSEYRQQPTSAKALVLYRLFCAPRAPARLSVPELLPPLNPQLSLRIRPIETATAPGHNAVTTGTVVGSPGAPGAPAAPRLVPKFLFDDIVESLGKKSARFRKAKRDYRARKTPAENLPFEMLTEFQRYFPEYVWKPQLKPALIAAGFWRVGAIG